ncbi:hypothetical protein LguiA_006352 [Lonicera macranthoides]
MSLISLNHFPLENMSLNSIPPLFLIIGFVEFIFFHAFLYFVKRNYNLLTKTEPLVKSQSGLSQNLNQDFNLNDEIEDGSLCREEVEMVMERLGVFCHPEGEKLQGRLGFDDLSKLFEEKEPSFDEVKGAFDVFDQNRDGFIDEIELQRVLCSLGLKNGTEVESCKRMINVFDENGDGRIDFNEFVKLMESSFG